MAFLLQTQADPIICKVDKVLVTSRFVRLGWKPRFLRLQSRKKVLGSNGTGSNTNRSVG